jgi:hypothetical protein
VRVPKFLDDPAWEVMPVPEALTVEDFMAALRLWRWRRAMNGQSTGDSPRPGRSRMANANHHTLGRPVLKGPSHTR